MSDALNVLSFRPINQAHAIVEAVFFYQFTPAFSDAALRRLSELEIELRDELPKVSPIQKLETRIEHNPDGRISQFIEKVAGIEFRKLASNGDVEWLLRVTEDTIAVHCLDYTSWEQIWPRAQRYLQQASRHSEGESNFLSVMGMKYVDRFVYEGPLSGYDARLLFAEEPLLLPQQFLTTKPLWHCYTGWFESLDDLEPDCLNQLNVDAAFVNLDGQKRHVTTIEHTAVVNLSDNASANLALNGGITAEAGKGLPRHIMELLHDHNKRLLARLLNNDIIRRIKLGVSI